MLSAIMMCMLPQSSGASLVQDLGPRTLHTGIVVGRPMHAHFTETITTRAVPARAARSLSVAGTIHRDSVGRTRTALTEQDDRDQRATARVIVIVDTPVAYILDPVSLTAIKRSVGAEAVRSRVEWLFPGQYSTAPEIEIVAGIACRRVDVSTVGQGQVSGTLRVWISDELQSVISEELHTRDEEYSWHLSDIHRGEPDPSLFRLPTNYKLLPSPQ
jgi:hypothetical protein